MYESERSPRQNTDGAANEITSIDITLNAQRDREERVTALIEETGKNTCPRRYVRAKSLWKTGSIADHAFNTISSLSVLAPVVANND